MKHVLLGYRKLDFDGRDGGRVQGTQLWTAFNSVDVKGQETSKLFIPSDKIPYNIDDYLGVQLDIEFNNKGKVVQIDFPQPVKSVAK